MREFSSFNQILLSLSTFQTHFMIVFELFTLFDIFLFQSLKYYNKMRLK